MLAPLAVNSTDTTVPSASVAVAVSVAGTFMAIDDDPAGATICTFGNIFGTTLTVISLDVIAMLFKPVTRVARRWMPTDIELFQLKMNGSARTGAVSTG